MRTIIPAILILWLLTLASAEKPQAQTLSPEAEIHLLTANPGEELYSVFGHSALWVNDPLTGTNEVYNWGVFNFQDPNFYIKFLQGRLQYMLAVTTLEGFLPEYQREGRGVTSQRLNLEQAEIRRIYDFLQYNRRPENIYYLYDFFYDNCATRIRDIAEVELTPDWGPDPYPETQRTFRQMVRPYVAHSPWVSFGIDLILGLPADRIATPWHYMFLPDEMFIAFQSARHADGRLLVNKVEEIIPHRIDHRIPKIFTPLQVAWAIFILGLLSLTRPRFSAIFDKTLFTILGIIGLAITFMWFFSDHIATAKNLNLLWTLPFHLYFIYRTKNPDDCPGYIFA